MIDDDGRASVAITVANQAAPQGTDLPGRTPRSSCWHRHERHQSPEVEGGARKAKEPVARSHWQIVWLLAQGKTTKQIVEDTGYGLSWIRTIAHRYNEGGPQALGDRRHGNPGAEAILSRELQQQLLSELQSLTASLFS